MPVLTRQQKITFAEMRAADVRGLLIYCADYKCSHWTVNQRLPGPSSFCHLRRADLEVAGI